MLAGKPDFILGYLRDSACPALPGDDPVLPGTLRQGQTSLQCRKYPRTDRQRGRARAASPTAPPELNSPPGLLAHLRHLCRALSRTLGPEPPRRSPLVSLREGGPDWACVLALDAVVGREKRRAWQVGRGVPLCCDALCGVLQRLLLGCERGGDGWREGGVQCNASRCGWTGVVRPGRTLRAWPTCDDAFWNAHRIGRGRHDTRRLLEHLPDPCPSAFSPCAPHRRRSEIVYRFRRYCLVSLRDKAGVLCPFTAPSLQASHMAMLRTMHMLHSVRGQQKRLRIRHGNPARCSVLRVVAQA